jgi:hypothetical protein
VRGLYLDIVARDGDLFSKILPNFMLRNILKNTRLCVNIKAGCKMYVGK